jgi:nucleotide-binding universal stress UspA family protein
LHLVHVHDVDYAYALPSVDAMPPIISPDEIERTITADLKSVAARCGAIGESATSHVRIGRAFDQICAVAAEVNAEPHRDLDAWIHRLEALLPRQHRRTRRATRARVPCLVVRDREREGEAEDVRKIRKILVPVDFSDCSRHGVSYAVALAKARGAALVLLHTLPVQPFVPAEPAGVAIRMPQPGVLERAARIAMAKFVRTIDFRDVPHETAIEAGPRGRTNCAHAEENDVDLIVTSTHGLTGFAHILIGSTAEHVVRYAKCPVLVVPRRDRGAAAKPTE